jgi:hypothetical protein
MGEQIRQWRNTGGKAGVFANALRTTRSTFSALPVEAAVRTARDNRLLQILL